MAINVVANRLRRMELNKCKLNHCFCSITKQQKYTIFHNGGGLNPQTPLWLRHCSHILIYYVLLMYLLINDEANILYFLPVCLQYSVGNLSIDFNIDF